MKEVLALFKARNIEYYRDKSSLAWAFLFPLMIIIGCAIAFSNPDIAVFKVGVDGDVEDYQSIALLRQPYIKTVSFADREKGLERLQYHQLDLFISQAPQRYWINTESTNSLAAETLFADALASFNKQQTSGRKVRYVDWVVPGVLAMNLMFGALFGVGYVIVRYRHNGVLKRLQATPVSALQFLTAQMASRIIIVVVVNGIIFSGCQFFLDLIVLGSYMNLLLITVIGSLSLIAVGLLVSCRTANEELAGGLLNAATWPMLFFSEVWFSLDEAPQWLRYFSDLMPLTHIVKAFRAVMIDGAGLGDISYHLMLLVALTGVCLLISASLFRWHRDG